MAKKSAATTLDIEENLASALCYLLGLVTGIIFLVLEKKNKTVKFHALQSIAITLVLIVLEVILAITIIGIVLLPLLGVLAFILWLMLMYKAYNGEKWKLPVIGDWAEKNSK